MRFQITLKRIGKQRMLPMDYQYYIGATIYHVIQNADPETAHFLHEEGYADGNKKFKLFNYSPLDLRPYKMWKDKSLFELQGESITLQVSFLVKPVASTFIRGLFMNQEIYLGDRFNGVDFIVTEVQALPQPDFHETMHYRTTSPTVISCKPEGARHAQYLHPEDQQFKNYFLRHLSQKNSGQLIASENQYTLNITESEIQFKLLKTRGSRCYTMKPGTSKQTRVRGFLFDFELTAPIEIHEMAYGAGFGEKNSMGFGWGEVMKR